MAVGIGARTAGRRRPLSLKARALAWLAQREHSVAELRRKLLRHARAEREQRAAAAADGSAPSSDAPAGDGVDAADDATRVDAVVEWLCARRYLSEERFVESRVHARSGRYGNLLIRHELARHGLALSPQAARALEDSELQRATDVWRRRFGRAPASAAERGRQSAFLARRGFSPEVVARLMREVLRHATPSGGAAEKRDDDGGDHGRGDDDRDDDHGDNRGDGDCRAAEDDRGARGED